MTDFELWEHNVKKICGSFHTQPHKSTPFLGDITRQSHDGLDVIHIKTNAKKIASVLSPHQENKHYCIILQKKGIIGFSNTNNDQLLLHPGEIALIDPTASYSSHPQGLIEQMSVHIPKNILDTFRDSHYTTFSKLSQHQTSSKVLLTILRQLTYAPPQCNGEGKAIQQAISALIPPSINNDARTPPTLKEVAQQHILRLLPEASLCPERLAKEMHISIRSLYRLFSEENISISGFILKSRIEQCCNELLDSDTLSQPISLTEVAFRWGFSDISQFSRSFKRIKGVSPSIWRESQQKMHNN